MKLLYSLLAISAYALPKPAEFKAAESLGKLSDGKMTEISGLCASRNAKDFFWVHNDSGDKNKIYGITRTGRLAVTVTLRNVPARDYEDISCAPGPNGEPYVYVADFGDNAQKRGTYQIYRFKEPSTTSDSTVDVETIVYSYPDGNKNAEAFMVDPITKDIYVVSKEGSTDVYMAKFPQSTDRTITLDKVASIDKATITAADMSSDGREILVKSYSDVLYWARKDNESVADAMSRPFTEMPYTQERQGESIAFDAQGTGYYTISEGRGADVNFYARDGNAPE